VEIGKNSVGMDGCLLRRGEAYSEVLRIKCWCFLRDVRKILIMIVRLRISYAAVRQLGLRLSGRGKKIRSFEHPLTVATYVIIANTCVVKVKNLVGCWIVVA